MPPNLVVLVMDTTRGDRVSLDGYPRRTTPRLDSLASEATVYANAWSPSCWTGPAHASLFTGLRPEHHGFLVGIRFFLDDRAVTIAERLSDAGYATIFLTCNPMVSWDTGLMQGFDVAEIVPETAPDGRSASRRATDRALRLARHHRSRGEPFLLVLNAWEPHLAYDPPEAFARGFLPADSTAEEVAAAREFVAGKEEFLGGVARSFTPRRWEILAALYEGEIATLDAELGRFVEGLRNLGILDDTVLVITSDHGENLGERGRCGHYMCVGRTVLHVPLLIRFPERFPAGGRIEELVRLEDVPPTLLSLAGRPTPPGLDGRSLLEPLEGRVARAVVGGHLREDLAREFPAYRETQAWRPLRSVFDGRFHLVQRNDGHEELYDVVADPGEERDLLVGRADLLPGLRRLLPAAPGF